MTLSEGGLIISEGINATKTVIPALDNLSIWQIMLSFLVLDVIMWGMIKFIRGRGMSESSVSNESQLNEEELTQQQSDMKEELGEMYGTDEFHLGE